jgi:hypothetical protein
VTWELYVDETGDFSAPDARVCVTGLLVDESREPLPVEPLRDCLRVVYPLIPFPPHATELKQLSTFVAAYGLHGCPVDDRSFVERPFKRAYEHLMSSADPVALAFGNSLQNSAIPRREVRLACDTLLRANLPLEAAELETYGRRCHRRMADLFDTVGSLWGPKECYVVAAWDVDGGGEEFGGAPAVHADRYLRTLAVLLERVVMLLRAPEGPCQQVRLRVAVRDLHPGPGAVRREHIGLVAAAAAGFPWLSTDVSGTVQFEPLEPERFDIRVHPGLVLADHIANRLFPLSTEPTWVAMERAGRRAFAIPISGECRALGRDLPAFCATGSARRSIFGGLQQTAAVNLANIHPGWARDQARQWVAAAQLVAV